MVKPFIYENVPSVISQNPANLPFVGNNLPNTGLNPIARRSHGFSLIELVVAMAVAAILVTVAIPNMRTFIQNGRLNTQANDLLGDLNLARSEAIKRRSNVGITTSATGACATGGNWRNGRVIFIDANNNGICDVLPDTILRFREQLASATDTLTVNPALIPDPLIFSANGASNVTGANAFFIFCDTRGAAFGKQVSLNSMGQASVSATPPGGC